MRFFCVFLQVALHVENSYFSSNLARSVDINQLEADGTDTNIVTAILNDPSSVSGSGGAIALNLDTTGGARWVLPSGCIVLYFGQKAIIVFAKLRVFEFETFEFSRKYIDHSANIARIVFVEQLLNWI